MANAVTQFQILSKTPDETAGFFSSLFGWSVDNNNPLGYRRIQTGSATAFKAASGPHRRSLRTSFSSSSR